MKVATCVKYKFDSCLKFSNLTFVCSIVQIMGTRFLVYDI